MSRDLDLTPRALPRTHYLGVTGHLDRLRREGLLAGPSFVEGNPHAVRVVAAATTESAYEYTNREGRRIGILTESLNLAIEGAGNVPISWRSILHRVRERVLGLIPQQHPDVEGPARGSCSGLTWSRIRELSASLCLTAERSCGAAAWQESRRVMFTL
jgi:hypothetical protein